MAGLPKALVALAVALSLLSLVERVPAFVPGLAAGPPALRGVGPSHRSGSEHPSAASAWRSGLQTAAAALAVGGAVLSARAPARRQAGAHSRTPMRVGDGYLEAGGPVVAYCNALIGAADKSKESVPVTKDIMKIKSKFEDEDFLEKLQFVQNVPFKSEMDRAAGTLELLQPLESTVVPKYLSFLAKKRRLIALKPICKEYMLSLYSSQSIAPVIVRSAERLSAGQLDAIKGKMETKIGASAIKLINEIDASLIGGFVIEWGFVDPEKLQYATEGIDLSLQTQLRNAAINKGVIVEI